MILSSGMVHTKNWRRNLKERWLTLSENGTLTWRRRDGYMIRGSTNIHQFFDKIDFDFDAYAASTAADDSSSCSSNDTVNSVKNVKNHGDTIDVKSTKIYLWILSVPIKMDVKTGRVKKWKNFRLATVAELDFWLQALANADGRWHEYTSIREKVLEEEATKKFIDYRLLQSQSGAKLNLDLLKSIWKEYLCFRNGPRK